MIKAKIAIIVAGGKGERMNADIPKQFLEIDGKPVLMYSLEVFHRYNADIQIILVLPEVQIEFWNELCKKHNFVLPHQIVAGGTTRFQSVKNGLKAVTIPSLVAIHDGVRPLVSVETIARCFDEAERHNAAIPVVDLVDSIRQITENGSQSVDRNAFKLVQTPQVFDSEILKRAYEQDFLALFTDDASVVEAIGETIHLVEGNRENIKITTEFDLRIAETLCKDRFAFYPKKIMHGK
ncbi:MAG: 2-C-methyl-D-erythritol 4-phosphate cytidylyltransferase [Paludibacter sp.]|nr:2-C-methyl-D-erythritol 4-phosphate cytidylyltransferase [Paludibacter sp.]